MSIKITDMSKVKSNVVMCEYIPIGTVFSGRLGNANSERGIFLRISNAIVSLQDTNWTWALTVTIYDYCPLDAELILRS